ncbi:MAG: hypothetical protein ABI912_06830 [Actinomycetota bacterium]
MPPDETASDAPTIEPSPSQTTSLAAVPKAKTSGKSLNIIILGVVAAGLLGLGGIAGLYFTRPRGLR